MTSRLLIVLISIILSQVSAMAQRNRVSKQIMAELEQKLTIPAGATLPVNRFAARNELIESGCDSIFLTRQSEIDSFNILNPGCTTVRKIIIDGQGASPAITRLDSLKYITNITEELTVINTSVTSLSALPNLVQIGTLFQLNYNPLLTSIGLNNLTQLGKIVFRVNPSLNSIAGLSNNIDTIGGILIDTSSLTSLSGLSGIVHFDGYLDIRNTPITNLSSLTSLVSINGYLRLESIPTLTSVGLSGLEYTWGFLFSSLDNLTTLAGLTNDLTTTNIGTFWLINTGITNFTGFDSLTSCVNSYIWINPNLTSLQGLQNVTGDIAEGISLWANDVLTDITALSNVTSLSNGDLDFHGNNQLSNLAGLGAITTIGKRLRVFENPVITSLGFLNSNLDIQDNENQGVEIRDNSQLSLCSFTPLCIYLNNGGTGDIQNNSAGCNNISEIIASCANCTNSGTFKTWVGETSSDWDDPANWNPVGVPAICDTVLLPEAIFGRVSYYPTVNSHTAISGLIMETGSSLDLNGYNLTCDDTLHISSANIDGGNIILLRNINNPSIEWSNITGNTITLENYNGSLDFYGSNFYGNTNISDAVTRTGNNNIAGNSFYGNFTLSANSTEAFAETYISNNDPDEIYGSATFNITTPAIFRVGNYNTLRIEGDLNLNTNIDSSLIELNEIAFRYGTNSHINQLGTTSISIRNLFPDKYSKSQLIIPEQNIYITNRAAFTGGLIKTTPSKLVIFKDNAYINQYSSESWIWGPVRKIGNDEFMFPTGDSLKQAVIKMTAPSQSTDVFTAQYFRTNPTAAGYDTALHAASLTSISGREYWMLDRENGSSNVRITLNYDSTRSIPVASLYSLRISRWNGSQWLNNGASSVTGSLAEAFVTSLDTLSAFGPITLGYVLPARIPIITVGDMDTVTCRNIAFKVRFTVDTLMYTTNNFIAQLSDNTGSFSSPLNIGYKNGANNSDSINAVIPGSVALSAG